VPVQLQLYLGNLDAVLAKLDELKALLIANQRVTMSELDTLKSEVEHTTTVEDSAIVLLNGLSAQIASLKGDPAALQALADQLSAKSADLAAAVSANTPPA